MKFKIALNMAGAISAGAYVAGVVDFLVDALDTWYAARAGGNFPMHDVDLCVLTGASAGGMTAAIAASALYDDFEPARSAGKDVRNRLHESWVRSIDAEYLLSNSDLEDDRKSSLRSLLNARQIEHIAQRALQIGSPRRRAYVNERLRLVLTLTNLQGTPYTVEPEGGTSPETQVAYHADSVTFDVTGGAADPMAYRVDPWAPESWDMLRRVAVATGAVPFALPVRRIVRKAGEYNERIFYQKPESPRIVDGKCVCEEAVRIPPDWDLRNADELATFNVDGGATNNDPLECALRELAAHGGPAEIRRSALEADRAVISIAPFPSEANFQRDFPEPTLATLAGQLISVLLRQSRFQGQEIHLMRSGLDFSRFFIAPSLGGGSDHFALAGASLGAFGGFADRRFREYDYQLGRRNCQWFLRKYFWLPESNQVIRGGLNEGARRFGEMRDGQMWYPIIPLADSRLLEPVAASYQPEAAQVESRRPQLTPRDIDRLLERAMNRIDALVEALPDAAGWSRLVSAGSSIAWLIFKRKVRRALRERIEANLREQQLM